MECSQCVKFLQAYIDGELAEARKENLVAHIKNCPTCRKKLKIEKQFRMIIIKKTKTVKAPPELHEKIRTVIF